MNNRYEQGKSTIVFILSAVIVLSVVIWGLVLPEDMVQTMTWLMNQMIERFGWFYVISTAVFVGFCLFLGFGPYRHMKLGNKEDKPEYSYSTWIGMLFAAGMGVGLVFWGAGEPMSHYVDPPPGTEAETQEAAEKGLMYGVFHWGIHPWSVYAIIAIGLAFAKYRKNLPGLISATFYPLIGNKIYGWPGKMIDIIAIVATTVGIATSLGLSTLQFNEGLAEVFYFPSPSMAQLMIILGVTVIFLSSVAPGLNRGMKYLSVVNLWLAGSLMVFGIILGPTIFIFDHLIKTIGDYTSNFIHLSLAAKPYTDNEWKGTWTFFYWAWVISWSPFVGTFIARVSRGRSLQEFIIGVLLMPSLVTVVWFVTFGGSGLYMEEQQGGNIASNVFETPEKGLFVVLEQLPLGYILSIASLFLILIFFVTSANSAAYVLGVFSSSGSLNPKNAVMIVWGILISSIAAVLLLSGGLEGLQATATITALPFSIIMLAMMFSIYQSLHKEGLYKHKVKPKEDW